MNIRGRITCGCGRAFEFETTREKIACAKCGEVFIADEYGHEVVEESPPIEEGDPDGTDL